MFLRIFKLTEEAKNKGIDWSNFNDDDDIEYVDKFKLPHDANQNDIEKILIENGYHDADIYGTTFLRG